MSFLEVVDFERFQHYKQRNPPWIKLHSSLLDNYEFGRLPDAAKMHLMGIWILASKSANRIPADAEWIAKRIGATTAVDIQLLVASGFLRAVQDDSAVLAPDKQPLTPSRVETESEKEAEKSPVLSEPAAGRSDNEPPDPPEAPQRPGRPAGRVMSTVRKVLWAPDGKCPDRIVKGRPWTEAREITVIDALLGVESEEDCIKACHGIKNLQRQGDVKWLEPGKASLLAVYHTKDGPRDMFSQALDAYYRGIPPPEPAKKRGGSPAPIDGVLDFSKFAKGA